MMAGRITWTFGMLAVGLLAGAVIHALLAGPGEPRFDASFGTAGRAPAGPDGLADQPEREEPAGIEESAPAARDAPAAQLLADSEPARRNLLRRVIADGGHACDEVRSAAPLDRSGGTWRVHCGQAGFYWVGVDEFGRWTVEAGSYLEPQDGPTGERTLTIQPEDVDPVQ